MSSPVQLAWHAGPLSGSCNQLYFLHSLFRSRLLNDSKYNLKRGYLQPAMADQRPHGTPSGGLHSKPIQTVLNGSMLCSRLNSQQLTLQALSWVGGLPSCTDAISVVNDWSNYLSIYHKFIGIDVGWSWYHIISTTTLVIAWATRWNRHSLGGIVTHIYPGITIIGFWTDVW